MSSTPEVGGVVVGAGIAGLAAALDLQRRVDDVVVIDASDRPGGVMRTDHVSGYVIEHGPNTFQVKGPMRAALRELGLDDALHAAQPAARLRFILRDGELVPAPTSPLGLLRTPLLTRSAKLRLLAEPLIGRARSEETVAEFGKRRFGEQVVTNLLGPVLTGVYAGDEQRLGAATVLAPWVELERRYRSVTLGGLASAVSRKGPRGLRGSWSCAEGLGPFARRLAERLKEPPALGASVTSLRHEAGQWHVEVSSAAGDRSLRTSRLVLATPAAEAAALLHDVEPRAAELLAGIEYAPIVAVPLGVDPSRVRRSIEGFGFLVPRDAGIDLLGCLFMSQLFPGRAPPGRELLHCMLGGTLHPDAIDTPDDVLGERLLADLDRTLGLEAEPEALAVTRWPRAIPQPGCDHVRRISEARERLAARPGLQLAGAYVGGVSVADSFASGLAASAALA